MYFNSFQGKTKLYFSTMTEIYDKLAPIVGPKSILREEVIDEIEMEDVMEGRSGENKHADIKKEIISKPEDNATVPELKEETKPIAISEIKEEDKATTVSEKEENKTTIVSELQEVKKKESITVEVPKISEGDSKSQNKTCSKSSSQDVKPVIATVPSICEKETEKPKSQSEVVEMVVEEEKKEGANPPAVETQQVGSPRASRSREAKPEEKKMGKK